MKWWYDLKKHCADMKERTVLKYVCAVCRNLCVYDRNVYTYNHTRMCMCDVARPCVRQARHIAEAKRFPGDVQETEALSLFHLSATRGAIMWQVGDGDAAKKTPRNQHRI